MYIYWSGTRDNDSRLWLNNFWLRRKHGSWKLEVEWGSLCFGKCLTRAELKLGMAVSKVTLICGTEARRKLKNCLVLSQKKRHKECKSHRMGQSCDILPSGHGVVVENMNSQWFTVYVLAYTRPGKDQTSQHSSMDGRGASWTSP